MTTALIVVDMLNDFASNDPAHHDVTLRYLDGHIARVIPTEDILTLITHAGSSSSNS
jgi:isochorismate hydrolase